MSFLISPSRKNSNRIRTWFPLVGVLVLTSVFAIYLFPAACALYLSSYQSSFLSKFSVQELIERVEPSSLNCSGGTRAGGGGGGGIGGVTGAVGRGHSQFNKTESYTCQIKDVDSFDEREFLNGLKANIEADLNDSKARVIDTGERKASSFYVEYELDDIKGKVEVSGTLRFDYYTVSAYLQETRGDAR